MKIRVLILLLVSAVLVATGEVLPDHSASVAITMTVAPAYGLVVELYDEAGGLVAKSDPAFPPAEVMVTSPEGRRAGIYVPSVRLASPLTVQIFIGATPQKRHAVQVADAKARQRGVSPIQRLSAIEFCASEQLSVRPRICLCFPSDLDRSVVDNLAVFQLDEAENAWVRLPACRTDPVGCTISAEATSFGVCRAMAQTATDLKHLIVLPNPFVPRLAAGGCVKFVNLTAEATIRIYDIQGRLVWRTDLADAGGSAFWYGTDEAGQALASGIYPYIIATPTGSETSGKITLIR